MLLLNCTDVPSYTAMLNRIIYSLISDITRCLVTWIMALNCPKIRLTSVLQMQSERLDMKIDTETEQKAQKFDRQKTYLASELVSLFGNVYKYRNTCILVVSFNSRDTKYGFTAMLEKFLHHAIYLLFIITYCATSPLRGRVTALYSVCIRLCSLSLKFNDEKL